MKRKLALLAMVFMAVAGSFQLPGKVSALEQNDVVILEFMADPSKVTDTRGEWVEVYNKSQNTVDMTGWDIDGSTIVGDIILAPNSLALVCRNSDPALNGGMTCDATSSYSLGNSSDTINLRDKDNKLVNSFSYVAENVQEGRATSFSFNGPAINAIQQYGLGDYGTPSSNKNSHVLVHAVLEVNDNKHPDFFWGTEQIVAGETINVYKISNGQWSYERSTTTTGKNLPDAAYLSLMPGEYALCLQEKPGNTATFAKEMTSFFVVGDNQVTNQSTENLSHPICSKVNAEAGKFTHHYLGFVRQ